jgi:hypothetical protein
VLSRTGGDGGSRAAGAMLKRPEQFVGGAPPQSDGCAEVCANSSASLFPVLSLVMCAVIRWLSGLDVTGEPRKTASPVPSIEVSSNTVHGAELFAARVIPYRRKERPRIRRASGKGEALAAPLREFLDCCIVPALVDKYFAERANETEK